jgi:hypothetical protein
MTARTLAENYRCREEHLPFDVSRGLSAKPGYFRLAPNTICYGRYLGKFAASRNGSAGMSDAGEIRIEGERVELPFDPDEVIDNLRLERYPGSNMSWMDRLIKAVYYQVRPVVSESIRIFVQGLRAARWETRGFPRWPVDTTVEDLGEKLLAHSLTATGTEAIPFVWFWPKGATGCVLMTHDLETERGAAFCEQLMAIDEEFGIRGSFQIVPEERYPVSEEFLERLRCRGVEICVQDLNHDGRLFDEREEFLRRAARINEYGRRFGANGYRSAVLYRRADWYGDLDFSYDMSIPNVAPMDPQRGGCCTVRPYFIGKILEIPLTTVQDYTLFYILKERTIDLWKQQIEMILAKNGLVSFIVHPDYIQEPETFAAYKQLLVYLREIRERRNLWFALPGEINDWWRARSQMSVVPDGKGWCIEGEGAERAVLAFAMLVDGKVVYQLEPGKSDGGLPHISLPAETRPGT